MKLPDPRVLLGALIWTLLVVAAGYMTGYERADEQALLRETQNMNKTLTAQRAQAAQVLQAERALRAAAAAAHLKYYEENENAKAATARLVSDLQRDVVRLRVPVKPRVCPASPNVSGPPATGPGEEGYAELSPDASVFVVGLLQRGDEAIRKHSAVVDLYEALRAKCSAPPAE